MTKRQNEPLLPMTQALSQLQADGNIKASAFHFLRMDFSKLATEDDFRKAYAGLAAAEQLLSPLDRGYARALSGIRKTLDQFAANFEPPLPADYSIFKKTFDELAGWWSEVLQLVKPHVPADLHEFLRESGADIFQREY